MPQVKLAFRCYHADCAKDLPSTLYVEIPRGAPEAGSAKKQKLVYCARNHQNVLDLPATWDARSPMLGDRSGAIAYHDGIPVVQGRQP
jgi:hypothetical protein